MATTLASCSGSGVIAKAGSAGLGEKTHDRYSCTRNHVAESARSTPYLSSSDRLSNSGNQHCASFSQEHHSRVGWSPSIAGGTGFEKLASQARQLHRHQQAAVVVRVVAKDEGFLGNIFKGGGGKKPEPDAVEDNARSGSQFFGIGGSRKKKAGAIDDDTEGPVKSGTGFFGIGGTKKSGTTNGTAFSTQKGTTKGTAQGTTRGTARGTTKGTTTVDDLPFGRPRRVDSKTVFVAGATGQIGARVTQQLLRAGFNVRGGVPDLYVAQQLAEFATQYGGLTKDESKRLSPVEFDFKSVSSIAKAIANAGKIVVTVGPNEDGPLGKVSREDALRVLEASTLSSGAQFVVVSDSGTGVSADDGPLAGLTALFGRVFSKSDVSESSLIDRIVETNLTYTIIKAGSTDGVDDYNAEPGNLVVEAEGAADPSAKVSKIQVASAVAGVLKFSGITGNKVFEVSSSPFAPSRPVDELFGAVQEDGRRAILLEKQTRLEAEAREAELREKVDAEAKEASEDSRRAAQRAAQLEADAKKLLAEEAKAAALASKAQAKAEAAGVAVDQLQEKAKELVGGRLTASPGRSGTGSIKSGGSVKKAAEGTVKKAADGTAKKFSFPFGKKKDETPEPVPVAASPAPKQSGFFGGLFSQETVYVDED